MNGGEPNVVCSLRYTRAEDCRDTAGIFHSHNELQIGFTNRTFVGLLNKFTRGSPGSIFAAALLVRRPSVAHPTHEITARQKTITIQK